MNFKYATKENLSARTCALLKQRYFFYILKIFLVSFAFGPRSIYFYKCVIESKSSD